MHHDRSFSFAEPYPKRTCSAPASVLLAAIAAADKEQAEADTHTNNAAAGAGAGATNFGGVNGLPTLKIETTAAGLHQQQQGGNTLAATPIATTPTTNTSITVNPSFGAILTPVMSPETTGLLPQQQQQQQQLLNIQQTAAASVAEALLRQQQIQLVQSLQLSQQLPPPPAGGNFVAAGLDAALMWMHSVALSLDEELQVLAAAQHATSLNINNNTLSPATNASSPAVSPTSIVTQKDAITNTAHPPVKDATTTNTLLNNSSNNKISISGRFQTLLALGRKEPTWAAGLFEAMSARYNHFAAITGMSPAVVRVKMAEYVLAALVESGVQHDLRVGGQFLRPVMEAGGMVANGH